MSSRAREVFTSCHPLINLLFYGLVLGISMSVRHPVLLALSGVGALCYNLWLGRGRAIRYAVVVMIPVFIISAAVNPLFSHEGATILGYFSTGNPITLESILYGLSTGEMLVVILLWFYSFGRVMTSDKFIYLFGKILPALSLILSMVLRFVPKFYVQMRRVDEAQRCIGRDVRSGSVIQRCSHGIRISSIMLTWALENSVDTADSMKARGYGLRGRSNYSNFVFDTRDRRLLLILLAVGGVIFTLLGKKVLFIRFYPLTKMNECTIPAVITYLVYGLFCLIPVILNLWEEIRWHYLQSKI